MHNLACNLCAGTRLALYLQVERTHFRFGVSQIFALSAIGLGLFLAVEYFATPAPVRFNGNGLPIYAAGMIAFLVGSYAVSITCSLTSRLSELLVLLLGASPLIYAVSSGFRLIVASHPEINAWVVYWIGWGFFAWAIALVERAVRILCGVGIMRRFAAVSVYGACTLAPFYAYAQIPTWYTERAATAASMPRPRLNVERTYYRQPELIERALKAVASQRPGVIDLYSIGFAGYGHEDVFMKEVLATQEILARRFDAGNRSVSLINNFSTVESVPLANRHNLEKTLFGIAAKMDVEEDVLFLFLTSHGSPNHYLATNLGRLSQNTISGRDIRRSLDEAGFRWRVVVVSACYSGGFIDALQGDGTMIITAARRDRTSFGCGVGREWTYFGEAFFANALSTGRPSFVRAYESAAAAVAARESNEGLTPSEPRISVGSEIADQLRQLENRLSRQADFDLSSTDAP